MTAEQKEKIKYLRTHGKSYKDIAVALGVKETTIKTFCYRNALTDTDIAELRVSVDKNICPNCGIAIIQKPKQKPRRFCCDKCRLTWWNVNRDLKNKKALYTLICVGCGKEFVSYGNKERKYCSRDCYFGTRFGVNTNADDGGAV